LVVAARVTRRATTRLAAANQRLLDETKQAKRAASLLPFFFSAADIPSRVALKDPRGLTTAKSSRRTRSLPFSQRQRR